MKQYNVIVNRYPANPRSKKRRGIAGGAVVTGSTSGGTTYVPGSGGTSNIEIITVSSEILPTDQNVFSASRTLVEINNALSGKVDIFDTRYLRKDIDDIAAGNIRFAKQVSSETFASGLTGTGWRITQEGDGEMRSLFLREWLETPELRYNRVTVTGDEFWVSTGLKVDKVEGNTITAKLEDGEVIAVQAGDILRGTYHYEGGFFTSFIKVLSVDTSAGTLTYEKIRGADPVRFMTFARQGNDTNESRQRSIYLSGLEGYQRFLGGVGSADITMDNIYAQFGNLDGLVTPYFGTLSGEGIYIRNGYIEGAIHVTGGNAATREFVQTEVGEGIANLAVGVDNLLLNTAFAGDYLPVELEEMTLFNRQKILYSDPLKFWTVTGAATVGTDEESRSGYACVLSGTLSQSPVVSIEIGEKYVASFKAKGTGTIAVSVGGASETFTLTSAYQKFVLKIEATGTEGFSLTASASATVCEIKLERGTVATDWEPAFLDNNRMEGRLQAMKYVFDAIKNETDIYGGLVLTNILMVGNYVNGEMSEVTAGLSGVYNDGSDVAFWAGGTLDEAIAAVADPSKTTGVANAVITHGGRAILNDAYVRGRIESSKDGNRIIIDPDERALQFFNSSDKRVIDFSFENTAGYQSMAVLNMTLHDTSGNTAINMKLFPYGLQFNSANGELMAWLNTSSLILPKMPTIDPHEKGWFWNDNGTVRVSLG